MCFTDTAKKSEKNALAFFIKKCLNFVNFFCENHANPNLQNPKFYKI